MNDDPDTALGFPSDWNFCYGVKPIATPNQEHQQRVCLSAAHITCPAFNAERTSSLPKELRAEKRPFSRKLAVSWVIVIIVLLLVVLGGLIFSGYWSPPWIDNLALPEWIVSIKPEETVTNTSVPVMETDTPVESETLEPPVTSTDEIVVATPVELAFSDYCAYPLETPIGLTRQFLVHEVVSGENIAVLTERYQTSASAIDAVNYFLPSPLWAEMALVIPIETEDVEGFPAFRPVFLEYDDLSIEELAEKMSVLPADLVEFNQLDPSCRSFDGWILIPAEKISP